MSANAGADDVVFTGTGAAVIAMGDDADPVDVNAFSSAANGASSAAGDDYIDSNGALGAVVDGGIGNDTINVVNVGGNELHGGDDGGRAPRGTFRAAMKSCA